MRTDDLKIKCQFKWIEHSREAEEHGKAEERDGPANLPNEKEQKDDNTKDKFDDLKIKCQSKRTEHSREADEPGKESANLPNEKEQTDDNNKEKFEDKTNILEQNQMDNSPNEKVKSRYEDNAMKRVDYRMDIENSKKVANETAMGKMPEAENPQIEQKKISTADNKKRNSSKTVLPGQQENGKLPSTNLTSADFTSLPKIKIASQKYPCYIPRVKKVVIEHKMFLIF